MKRLSQSILLFSFFFCLSIHSWSQRSNLFPYIESGEIKADFKGTGKVSGHVLTIHLKNLTSESITVDIGPLYVPSKGKFQPYIIPETTPVTIPPDGEVSVPLDGICTDHTKPPVSSGKPGPGSDMWTTPTAISNNWQPEMNNGWQPNNDSPLINPVSGQPLNHSIDLDKYPVEGGSILFDYVSRIRKTIEDLQDNGGLSTPYSDDPMRERQFLLTQTIWYIASYLRGKPYTISQLSNTILRDYATNTSTKPSKIPATILDELEDGTYDIWNTIQLVGVEAKILNPELIDKEHEAEPAQIPGTTYGEPLLREDALSDRDRFNQENKQCFLYKINYKITGEHTYTRGRGRRATTNKDTHHGDADNEIKVSLERDDILELHIKELSGICNCWTAINAAGQKTGPICDCQVQAETEALNRNFNNAFEIVENVPDRLKLKVKRKYSGTVTLNLVAKGTCNETGECKGSEFTRQITLKITAPRR
jgi:hypothetical protein